MNNLSPLPAAVLTEDDVTERQSLLTSALMDARMGRYLPFLDDLVISHRALTEQVRVLRECIEWYADEDNWDFGIESARIVLAALEGQPQ